MQDVYIVRYIERKRELYELCNRRAVSTMVISFGVYMENSEFGDSYVMLQVQEFISPSSDSMGYL